MKKSGADGRFGRLSYEGLNILMAEDNEMNAEIAVGILEMRAPRWMWQ
ncbi:MAG: hypothetical protein ACLVJO_09815 [[Clostridium] scindens]